MTAQPSVLSNRQLLRAALVVLVGFLASGVLGFIRTAVLSAVFGAGEALDAFYAAQQIPELIFVLVAGGALGSSFIPIFARQRENDPEQAWCLASAVMTLAALAAALLGLVVILAAPLLVEKILMSGKSSEAQALTTAMIRLMMVTPFIFSISGLVMGILQSHGLFFLPSVAISMNNIGIIVGALMIAPLLPPDSGLAQVGEYNVFGLAYGAVLSALLHLIVQIPGLRQIHARLRPMLNFRIEGVIEVILLMGPRVLGLAVVRINFIVNVILTSSMIEGSLVVLNTAFNLMFFALGIIAQSVGSAVFPTLSTLAAQNDFDGFKERLSAAMRSVLFLALPATVGILFLAESVVSIYERGNWTPESTSATAWALRFYAIGMAGFALLEVLSRAFYALSDTWTPVFIGVGAMISNILLSLILSQIIGDPDSLARGPFAGLALANALTTLVEALALWILLRRRIGRSGSIAGLRDDYIFGGIWRAGAASVAMGAALWALTILLPGLNGVPLAIIGVIVGAGVFFGVSMAIGLEESLAIPQLILRKFRRASK